MTAERAESQAVLRVCVGGGRSRLFWAAVIFCVWFAPMVRGEMLGEIVRVGYPTSQGDVVRVGAWTPVVVDLSLQNAASFTGELRLRQTDRDGDVYVDSRLVNLTADAGAQRRYWLYSPASTLSSDIHGYEVELLVKEDEDDPGRLVEMISNGSPTLALRLPVPPAQLRDDDNLILVVSERMTGRIRQLTMPNRDDTRGYARPPQLAHISPRVLPNHWFGLEMVDWVVWEQADPTELTDAQQKALVEWLYRGGKLLISAARTADTVAQSDHFRSILPVDIGEVSRATGLNSEVWRLFGFDESTPVALKPFPYVKCKTREAAGAKALAVDSDLDSTMIASRVVGKGRLTYVACALDDLLGNCADPVMFFRNVLELRKDPISVEQGGQFAELFRFLDRETAFMGSGSIYLALALLFAITYVLLATLGVWKFLQVKGRLKHSWVAFAVVAAVASMASIAGVQASRGVSRKLHQLAVVDGRIGEVEAEGSVYFGLVSPVYSDVDVWLPSDPLLDTEPQASKCFLRPMPQVADWGDSGAKYTDSASYQLMPSTAEIHDVPLRATLKQFEGRWAGHIRGTLNGSLGLERRRIASTADGGSGFEEVVFTADSWIENNLGVDLEPCYVFWAKRDTFTRLRGSVLDTSPRADNDQVMVCRFLKIEDGQRVNVFDRIFRGADGHLLSKREWKDIRGLRDYQSNWGRPLAGTSNMPGIMKDDELVQYNLTHYQNAVLLLTTLSDFSPGGSGLTPFGNVIRFSRSRVRQLDMSDLLTADTALVVGFSNGPGPVRLGVRTGGDKYKAQEPDKAITVYRFTVPLRRSDLR